MSIRIPRAAWTIVSLAGIVPALACATYSEPPQGWEGEFTADAVLAKAWAALGAPASESHAPAEDFVATLKGTTLTGPAAGEYTYVAMWKRPDLWRLDQTGADGTVVRLVSDGVRTARFDDGKLVTRDLPLREAGIHQLSCCLFPLKFFREGAGTKPVLEDVKETQDGELIRVSKVDGLGNRYVLSIDAKTHLPRAIRTGVPAGEGEYVIRDTTLADFEPDARAGLVPRALEVSTAGRLSERLRVEQLRWNQGLAPDTFKTTQ